MYLFLSLDCDLDRDRCLCLRSQSPPSCSCRLCDHHKHLLTDLRKLLYWQLDQGNKNDHCQRSNLETVSVTPVSSSLTIFITVAVAPVTSFTSASVRFMTIPPPPLISIATILICYSVLALAFLFMNRTLSKSVTVFSLIPHVCGKPSFSAILLKTSLIRRPTTARRRWRLPQVGSISVIILACHCSRSFLL
jgi:hypothetical protein